MVSVGGGSWAWVGIGRECAGTPDLILVLDRYGVGDEMVNGVIPLVWLRPLVLSGAAGSRNPGRQELWGSRSQFIGLSEGVCAFALLGGGGGQGGVSEFTQGVVSAAKQFA